MLTKILAIVAVACFLAFTVYSTVAPTFERISAELERATQQAE